MRSPSIRRATRSPSLRTPWQREERWRFSTRLPGGCAARPRLPPAKGSRTSASSSTLRTDEACSSPTAAGPAVAPCSCVGTTPAGARRSESPYASGSSTQPPGVTPDGRLLVVADRGVKALDAETLRVIRRYPFRGGAGALSPDGRALAIEPPDGGLGLLDLASGRVRTLTGPGAGAPMAFSPDGRTLSTAEDDGNVTLWDVEQGVPTETLEGHTGFTETHAFSPDGRTLYTAGNDGRVIVWDVAGDRRLGRPFPRGLGGWEPGHGYPPAFALSPDGRAVAVARLDGRVELIDAETLRRTGGFEAFPGRAGAAIDYSADGRRLAVAGEGGGVGVWDAESGERLGALLRAPRGPRTVNPRTVRALAFGQGDLLAAAEVGGAVRIWDVGRRELLRPPLRLPPSVYGLAFSPDGSQLAIPFGARLRRGSQRSRDPRRRKRRAGCEAFPRWRASNRLPSPPTAACSRVAWSAAARSSGRPTAGGGWEVRSLARPRPLSKWSSPRTGTRLRPHTTTTRWRSGTSPRRSRSGPPWALSSTRGTMPRDGAIQPRRRPPVRAIRPRGGQRIEPRARDPLGGRSRALAATRVRRRRRRPHSRAVGRGRARAGLLSRPAPPADELDRGARV